MKWKKDDIRCEYRPFYILSFLLLSLFFIRKLISCAVPLYSLFLFQELKISLSVWQNIIHACFENIGYLIDFEE